MGMPSRVGPVAILGLLWAAIVVVMVVVVVLVDAAQRNRRAAAEGHQLWEASWSVFGGQKVESSSGSASAASTRRGRGQWDRCRGFFEERGGRGPAEKTGGLSAGLARVSLGQ